MKMSISVNDYCDKLTDYGDKNIAVISLYYYRCNHISFISYRFFQFLRLFGLTLRYHRVRFQ